MVKKTGGVQRFCTFRLIISLVLCSPLLVIILRVSIGTKSATTGNIIVDSTLGHIGRNLGRKKVAYAITVTKDGPFVDGALVLGHAALKVHDSSQGFQSEYDADLIAIVAPGVSTSRTILENYGWKIVERGLPVQLDEIVNRKYAENMKNSGCCGADEFLKLWAFTLTEYHRVIHLDMDSIIFKNMVSNRLHSEIEGHFMQYEFGVLRVPTIFCAIIVLENVTIFLRMSCMKLIKNCSLLGTII